MFLVHPSETECIRWEVKIEETFSDSEYDASAYVKVSYKGNCAANIYVPESIAQSMKRSTKKLNNKNYTREHISRLIQKDQDVFIFVNTLADALKHDRNRNMVIAVPNWINTPPFNDAVMWQIEVLAAKE